MTYRKQGFFILLSGFMLLAFGCNAQAKEKDLKLENENLKKEISMIKESYNKLLSEVENVVKNKDAEQADKILEKEKALNRKSDKYKLSAQTRIGHVHLKVSDLERSIAFYRDVLGFEVTMMYGSQAAFLSAGGYHHHIGLNTWTSKGAPPASEKSVGLYHTAILYPTRRDLALAVEKLMKANYPISGASDHGVSEAIYLNDPDGNGVELYWDKPREQWPKTKDGSLDMYTHQLDFEGLMNEI